MKPGNTGTKLVGIFVLTIGLATSVWGQMATPKSTAKKRSTKPAAATAADIEQLKQALAAQQQQIQQLVLQMQRISGAPEQVPLTSRIDTAIEVDYYVHGGILPYVLRQLLGHAV